MASLGALEEATTRGGIMLALRRKEQMTAMTRRGISTTILRHGTTRATRGSEVRPEE